MEDTQFNLEFIILILCSESIFAFLIDAMCKKPEILDHRDTQHNNRPLA